MTETRFRVLHALRVKGFADVSLIAELADTPPSVVEQELAIADDAGLVTHRTGRITGWVLTAAGRAAHAELLARHDGDLLAAYRLFEPINAEMKATFAAWQLRGAVPNDHTAPLSDSYHDAWMEPVPGPHPHARPDTNRRGRLTVRRSTSRRPRSGRVR